MTDANYFHRYSYVREDHQQAFDEAIDAGVFSADQESPVWAGRYMYMYSMDGKDYFKNIETRRYVVNG